MTRPLTQIEPQPGIMEITPYKGGDAKLDGHEHVLKLSSNENPFGPSQKAVEAVQRSAPTLNLYPSTDHRDLREAIARVFTVDANRVICGAGSDEILHLLCQTYAGPGDEIVYTEHGFSMYRILGLAAGATPVKVPENNRMVDVDAILAGCNERTRIVFVTNPGNPTGTKIRDTELDRLAQNIPPKALLVLDGAYAEFVPGFNGCAELVDARENVVMTRTMSKIFGLGGMRVGWGYGPEHVIGALNRVRGPFNLSTPALVAAAAAIQDVDYTSFCQTENIRNREWLRVELAKHGVQSDPSHANFILARFRDAEEAKGCDAYLRRNGIIVRQVGGYGIPEGLRITIGDSSACEKVAETIGEFLKVHS
ncbi:histidinol-phosphate transaminase [Amaricoccus tamworthensis]|uniref:histidinol-phosphate transaminase n=1 Tax=Amaricoccus tamworthensis TaxID=57002 RepID=UPI003C7A12F7